MGSRRAPHMARILSLANESMKGQARCTFQFEKDGMNRIKAQALIAIAIIAGICRAAGPLQFEKSIPLESVSGRIDHMAADPKGGRLFVAALGNKTLEVIDWNSGKTIKSIAGLDEPQGIVYRSDSNRLYVATGGDGSVQMFDGSSFML